RWMAHVGDVAGVYRALEAAERTSFRFQPFYAANSLCAIADALASSGAHQRAFDVVNAITYYDWEEQYTPKDAASAHVGRAIVRAGKLNDAFTIAESERSSSLLHVVLRGFAARGAKDMIAQAHDVVLNRFHGWDRASGLGYVAQARAQVGEKDFRREFLSAR